MNNLPSRSFNESVPITLEQVRRTDNGFAERHVLNDNGGLSSFHHFEEKEDGGNRGKLIGGALVVALLLGAVGIYAYTGSGSNPAALAGKTPVTSMASDIPATAPIQTTPMTPPAATPAPDAESGTSTKSPYDAAPAAAPAGNAAAASATPGVTSDKPVKSARAPLVEQKDDAAQNTTEAGQTVPLNRDSSAADRATQNGSVAVPLPAAPSSSVASKSPTPEADSTVQEAPAPAATTEQQPAVALPAPQAEQPPPAAQPQ